MGQKMKLKSRDTPTHAYDDGVRWPKAVAKITKDTKKLLCFFDFPAEQRAGAGFERGVLVERAAASQDQEAAA
jgi:hypothetical protein